MEIRCLGCNRIPEEIPEYISEAKLNGMTPLQFVLEEEGTFNLYEPNRFYCTNCFIEAMHAGIVR